MPRNISKGERVSDVTLIKLEESLSEEIEFFTTYFCSGIDLANLVDKEGMPGSLNIFEQ